MFHKQHRLGRMTALFAAATVPQQRVFFGKVLVQSVPGQYSLHVSAILLRRNDVDENDTRPCQRSCGVIISTG